MEEGGSLMAGSGATIAQAYVELIPTFKGIQGAIGKEIGGASKEFEKAGSDSGGAFSGGLDKMLKGGAIIGSVVAVAAGAGAAFVHAFSGAAEREFAAVKTGAAMGLTGEESKALGQQAGKLYAQGYGESIPELTAVMGGVKSAFKDLNDVDLANATKNVTNFATVFDVDASEAVQHFSTLVGSGLVADVTGAADFLTATLQKVPEGLRGAVTDAADEYAPFFKQLGIDAAGMGNAFVAGAAKGEIGIDKTGDAIKEFTIRATDMSSSTSDTFSKIGLDAGQMANAFLAGGDQAKTAMAQTITGLQSIQDPAEQANAAIALFGTPLEDLGTGQIPAFLASLAPGPGALGDFAGAAANVDAALSDTMSNKVETIKRSFSGIGTNIMDALAPLAGPVLDTLTGFATKVSDVSAAIGPGIQAIIDLFKTGNFTGGTVLGDEDSPIVSFLFAIRDTVGSVVGQIVPVFKQMWDAVGPALMGAFQQLWGAIQPLIPIVMDLLPLLNPFSLIFHVLLPVLPKIAEVVGTLATALGGILSTALQSITPVLKMLADLLTGEIMPLFTDLAMQIVPILTTVVDALLPVITDLATTIGNVLGTAMAALTPLIGAVVDVINRLMPFVNKLVAMFADLVQQVLPPLMSLLGEIAPLFQTIFDAVMPVVTMAIDLIMGLVDTIMDSLMPVIRALMPIVQRVFGFIADTIGNVVTIFKNVIDFVKNIFSGEWGAAWENIVAIFGAVWDQVKNVFSTLWDVASEFFSNLLPRIWDLIKNTGGWLIEKGGELLGWLWQGVSNFWTNTAWPWLQSLPSLLWDGIKAAATWLAEKGGELLGWLWGGITSFFTDTLLPWFGNLPSLLWEGLKSLGQGESWLLEKGKEFLGWLWNGITSFVTDTLIPWFGNLPSMLWEGLKTLGQGEMWLLEKGKEFLGWLWNGITSFVTDTLIPWFGKLPGMLWDGLKTLGQGEMWLLDRGVEFLTWLWNGITSFFTDTLGPWFADLPSTLWDKIKETAGAAGEWLAARGSEFIGWLKDGIVAGATALWNWVIALPTTVWTYINNLKDIIIQLGKDFVGWIAEGIGKAADLVAKAVTALFHLDLNSDGTGYVNVGVVGTDVGIPAPGGARGAVVPGRDPGRRDNVLGRLPNGVGFGLRSGEAVMVPEFTRGVGGAAGVYRLNRLAEAGLLGFAWGGVVPGAKDIGRWTADGIAKSINKDDISKLWDHIGDDVRKSAGFSVGGNVDPNSARGRFIAAALSKQGTEYVWGAAGPNVFDCSGLMSWALEQAGVGKGRLTASGFNHGFPHVSMPGQPGDMVTFDTGRIPGDAGHIGVIVDPARGLMMHTDGAGPARVSDYLRRDGGPLSVLDVLGGSYSGKSGFTGILSNVKGFITAAVNNLVGPSGDASALGGSGVERWRPLVLQALNLIGQSAGNVNAVLNQIRTESSGDPSAINLTDVNAQRGTPSKGLVQVIDPTFRRFALAPYNQNIWDPLSNLIAGIRYAISTYGSIAAGMRGVAYDSGGWLMPMNMLREPEPVLSPSQWKIADEALAAVRDSGRLGGEYHWNVYPVQGQEPADIAREMDRLLAFSAHV